MTAVRPESPRAFLAWLAAALGALAVAHGLALHDFPGPGGDNAEFQHLGRVLGVSHPTGYPLYLLATHAWDRVIPFGTAAGRINAFSLVCGLGACACLGLIARQLRVSGPVVFLSLLALGLTPPWFRLATTAEVYTLHTLLVCAALALALRWHHTDRPACLRGALLVLALGAAHHLTIVLLAPALVLLAARSDWRRLFTPATLGFALLCLAAVAGLYAYVFIRSADPSLEFAYVRVLDWAGFRDYLTGAQYQGNLTARDTLGGHLAAAARLALDTLRPWGSLALLVPLGLPYLLERDRVFARVLLAFAATQFAFMACYRIADILDYLLPLLAMGALLLMALLQAVADWLALPLVDRRAKAVMRLAGLLLLALFLARARGTLSNLRAGHARADAEAIRAALFSGPAAHLVVPHWQQFAIARYYRAVEGAPGTVEMLVPADAAARDAAGFALHLREWAASGRDVLVFSKPGPLHDLAAPLARAGAATAPLNPHVRRVLAPPPAAP